MQNENPLQEALKSLRKAEIDLLRQLNPIQEAIKSIEFSMNALDNQNTASSRSINAPTLTTVDFRYDKNWSLSTKFRFLLKKYNRFLHFREAADLIIQIEGAGDQSEITSKLSANTNSIKQSGVIVKYKASKINQDTFWGLPKWLDDNGNIKEGHELNRDYLYENKRTSIDIEF